MDYTQMTGPCGIDCFNCPVFLANENEALRDSIAKFLDAPVEKAVCKGCHNETGVISCMHMTEACDTYQCVQEKNVTFCYECSDFPCDHLHPYADMADRRPHNTKIYNLCLIRKMGLESWAENKAKLVRDVYFNEKWKL